MTKTHIIKHYKQLPNGKLKFIKQTRIYNKGCRPKKPKRVHVPSDVLVESKRNKLTRYQMRVTNYTRMRTGHNPFPGECLRCKSHLESVYLFPSEVKKLGVVGAYRKRKDEYFQAVREGRVKPDAWRFGV